MRTTITNTALLLCAALPAVPAWAANESYLRIACENDNVGAQVRINGVLKGECPLDVQVKPGAMVVVAMQKIGDDRERRFEQKISLGEGVAKRIDIVLPEARLTADAEARLVARAAAAVAETARQEQERVAALAKQQQQAAETLRQQTLSAEAGEPVSMFKLARRYESGYGVQKNRDLALDWYRRAADTGYAPAQCGVAAFANNGWIGGKPDYKLARELATAGAAVGEGRCMGILYTLYSEGNGGLPIDIQTAAEWLQRGVETGQRNALYLRAQQLARYKLNLDLAMQLAVRAAEPDQDGYPGLVDAMYMAGFIAGIDVPGHPKDDIKAFGWYMKASEAGSVSAMGDLGLRYLKGNGVAKDTELALDWLRKAAALGDGNAMHNLGVIYDTGNYGIARNEVLAIEWYTVALAAGEEVVRPKLKRLTR